MTKRRAGRAFTTSVGQFVRRPNRYELRLIAILFGISLFASLAIWQVLHHFDSRLRAQNAEIAATGTLRQARLWLDNFIDGYAADLTAISLSYTLLSLDGTRETADRLSHDFAAWAKSRDEIAQIRYLDAGGKEIVRVDSHDSAISFIPESELQDKSARYYFTDAIGLPQDSIYISPFDLNVEHGAVEQPWRPTIRLARPVLFSGDDPGGVLVLNLDASEIIEKLPELTNAPIETVQLLNGEGYWMAGAPKEDLWGFMFGNDRTLAARQPDLWSRISATEGGSFRNGDRFYAFERFSPAGSLNEGSSLTRAISGDRVWYLLVEYDAEPALWRAERLPRFIAIVIGCAVFSGIGSLLISTRRQAERRAEQAEEQLVRSERMAHLGGLVAGVAHELNTPIGNALTISSTLQEHAAALSRSVESGKIARAHLNALLADINDGAGLVVGSLTRAAEIIRYFKQIAADQTSDRRRRFALDDYIRDTVKLVEPQFKNTPFRLAIGELAPVTIDGYPGPLGQVIANLVSNALLHGFEGRETGTVTISARAQDPQSVAIMVEDDGKGMSPHVLKKAFDPFFTTRMNTGGSGLGLSIVHNIVVDVLGGTVDIESAEGRGTSITVTIPDVALDGEPQTKENRRGDT